VADGRHLGGDARLEPASDDPPGPEEASMKGLDTPILLELLRGRPSLAPILKSLEGEELATTEVNVFELEAIARSGPRHGREHRRAALDRLRRKLTVLPIDGRAIQAAASLSTGRLHEAAASEWLMLGAASASGCSEWVTTASSRYPRDLGKLPVKVVGK
jgi:predicted nucleic acid-binding protein